MVIRKETSLGLRVDCCPSTTEMVEPEGGITQDGLLVKLYSEGTNRQRFYEISCREGVAGKPCRFIDRKLHNQSVCVQNYSYTYALVRDPRTEIRHHHREGQFKAIPAYGSYWTLDYIKVRNGCHCVLEPKQEDAEKPPHRGRKHKTKRGKRRRESFEDVSIVNDDV
ncbi:hypothetical protein AAG570_004199 [Ranatra chinensis]|uniref:Spaetzle domain-containing protein n=1 Tax=Ranatra chinensis TaxID=642074 RepID=A0ABD0Y345_9HEMI